MKKILCVCIALAALHCITEAGQVPGSLSSTGVQALEGTAPRHPAGSVDDNLEPLPPACPWNSIFGQLPTHPDSEWTAHVSDTQIPQLVYDNFWELQHAICDIHWWGFSLGWDPDIGWFRCDEDPMTFEIRFYTDINGQPGEVECVYTVVASRQATGIVYYRDRVALPLYYWSTMLAPCCTLRTGWVSIQGVSIVTPVNCMFVWINSPQGDNNAWKLHPTGRMELLRDDLAFCLTPGEPPYDMDMGDIIHPLNAPIGYPTLVANPGHLLSGIAWLGPAITGEPAPNVFDIDPADDGVLFPRFMIPCTPTTVTVTVTAGPNYPSTGVPLFLSAWKDGNDDGDFCDVLCPTPTGVLAPEWIIQDVPVAPGVWNFTFTDPGIPNVPPYAGWFRFRLTSVPVGQLGFGLGWPRHCPGTFGVDQLGEVEDYFFRDYQLAVELTSFEAVAGANEVMLRWVTASETNNDYFDLERDGRIITQVPTKGNSATGHSYAFSDRDVTSGTAYTYTLASVDLDGNRQVLATRSITPDFTVAAPVDYALYQNYPNPFNAVTTFVFDLKEATTVSLKLYNVAGQAVATVLSGDLSAGRHEVAFDASALPSGMYLYRLDTPSFSAAKKMLLMK